MGKGYVKANKILEIKRIHIWLLPEQIKEKSRLLWFATPLLIEFVYVNHENEVGFKQTRARWFTLKCCMAGHTVHNQADLPGIEAAPKKLRLAFEQQRAEVARLKAALHSAEESAMSFLSKAT